MSFKIQIQIKEFEFLFQIKKNKKSKYYNFASIYFPNRFGPHTRYGNDKKFTFRKFRNKKEYYFDSLSETLLYLKRKLNLKAFSNQELYKFDTKIEELTLKQL